MTTAIVDVEKLLVEIYDGISDEELAGFADLLLTLHDEVTFELEEVNESRSRV